MDELAHCLGGKEPIRTDADKAETGADLTEASVGEAWPRKGSQMSIVRIIAR